MKRIIAALSFAFFLTPVLAEEQYVEADSNVVAESDAAAGDTIAPSVERTELTHGYFDPSN